jgi:hypothetical protein
MIYERNKVIVITFFIFCLIIIYKSKKIVLMFDNIIFGLNKKNKR